ncbi:MAG TPA: gliding motility-associated C-terminal domain-containing protein [Saprospiraceae bacterium]|nr:gliding motility-associated C-terminal domain-containing protein [Saprospiraceae bacterium]
MKNCLYLLLLLATPLLGQTPFSLKVQGLENADGLLHLPDGGFIWAGIQGGCIELIHISEEGNPVWMKSVCPVLLGTDISYGNLHLANAGDGSFYLLFRKGAFSSAPDNYLILMHMDAQGNILWETALPPQKRYGSFSSGTQLLVQPDGNIWAAHAMGFTDDLPDFNQALLYRVDPSGAMQLRRYWRTDEPTALNGLAPGSDGTFLGYGSMGFSVPDGFLMQLSANGNLMQAFRFLSFYFMRDGGIFANGDLAFMGKHGDKFAVVRVRADGSPVWCFELPDDLSLFSIRVTTDDALMLAVRTVNQRFALLRINGSGTNVEWTRHTEDCTMHKVTAMTALSNGSICVAQANQVDGGCRLFTVDSNGNPGVDCSFFMAETPNLTPVVLQHVPIVFMSTDINDPVTDRIFASAPTLLAFSDCCPSELVEAHFELPDSLCAGSPLLLSAPGSVCAESWTWTLEGAQQTPPDAPSVTNVSWNEAGRYLIQLKAAIGTCNQTMEDTLLVVNPPDVSFFPVRDTAVCPNKPFTLTAEVQGFNNWIWQDGLPGNERVWSLPEAGSWVLSALKDQCLVSDTLHISFADCGEPVLYAPNVFTPNDDGSNDSWEVFFEPGLTPVMCRIFDRWGNLCYVGSEGRNIRWNGQVGGKNAPAGVYTWVLQFRTQTGMEEQRSGDLLLLR